MFIIKSDSTEDSGSTVGEYKVEVLMRFFSLAEVFLNKIMKPSVLYRPIVLPATPSSSGGAI